MKSCTWDVLTLTCQSVWGPLRGCSNTIRLGSGLTGGEGIILKNGFLFCRSLASLHCLRLHLWAFSHRSPIFFFFPVSTSLLHLSRSVRRYLSLRSGSASLLALYALCFSAAVFAITESEKRISIWRLAQLLHIPNE